MCNLYSITTNQAAIIALFRVVNRYVGNLPPMPGVFPDYPAPVVRNAGADRELTMMRWGMPPPSPGVTAWRRSNDPQNVIANDSCRREQPGSTMPPRFFTKGDDRRIVVRPMLKRNRVQAKRKSWCVSATWLCTTTSFPELNVTVLS